MCSKKIVFIGAIFVLIGVLAVSIINSTEDTVEKIDISITKPLNGETVESPLRVSGKARGYWFFEGDSPLVITDWDGRIIGESYITAKDNWMTEEFVLFTGTIEFEKQAAGSRGYIIFQKDNASGLPEHDDAVELQILF